MLKLNYYYRQILIILFSLSVIACGFQLRGEGSKFLMPPNWKKFALITSNPQSEFIKQVVMVFQTAEVKWETTSSADHILTLKPAKLSTHFQSLNSKARPSEIELTLTSYISISNKDGVEILPEIKIYVRRRINNDPANATGVNEQINLITSEMRRQLAENILLRVSTLAHSAKTE